MDNIVIETLDAPKAIGTYSQGIKSGNLVFTSGQIPLNPETGELINGDFKMEISQVLTNLNAVLKSGGSSLKKAIKLTVFLTDLSGTSGYSTETQKSLHKELKDRYSDVVVYRNTKADKTLAKALEKSLKQLLENLGINPIY